MKNKVLAASIGLAGVLLTQQALALPFSSFDPRSFAMGGAGVASGTSANAVFFNPALLAAATQDDDFSFELLAGVRAADPDNMLDAIDDFDSHNSMQAFSDAILAYNASPGVATAADLDTARNQLIADLQNLSQKAVQTEADGALVVGVPSKSFGISIYGNRWVVGGAYADVTAADLTDINNQVDNLPTPPVDNTGSYTSSFNARLASITEAGVALATTFGGVAVGITPKHVKVATYDYSIAGKDLDTVEIDTSLGEKTDTNFNIDIGIAKDYGNGWKTGLAVKNVLSKEYTTVLGNKITIDPMARVGVMHETSWSTIALDVDLTENDPGGLDNKSQFAALGIEFDAFNFAQLRLGIRHNMSDIPYDPDILSAGIGLSPFGINIDLSVAGNQDDVGAALQLGFRF